MIKKLYILSLSIILSQPLFAEIGIIKTIDTIPDYDGNINTQAEGTSGPFLVLIENFTFRYPSSIQSSEIKEVIEYLSQSDIDQFSFLSHNFSVKTGERLLTDLHLQTYKSNKTAYNKQIIIYNLLYNRFYENSLGREIHPNIRNTLCYLPSSIEAAYLLSKYAFKSDWEMTEEQLNEPNNHYANGISTARIYDQLQSFIKDNDLIRKYSAELLNNFYLDENFNNINMDKDPPMDEIQRKVVQKIISELDEGSLAIYTYEEYLAFYEKN